MRDIPPGSIAAEIMDTSLTQHRRAKSILNDIKDISRKLSDFESCQSSMSSSSSSEEDPSPDRSDLLTFKTMNSKKRGWKGKRKASQTPEKKDFLKKLHKSTSPQQAAL